MNEKILLSHGSGGLLTKKLIDDLIVKKLKNEILEELNDSAFIKLNKDKIYFTTDSYVVNPIFFPGGDIGSLAIHGTVNDLAVSGAKPLFLSLSFIIEEGLEIEIFERILNSISLACKNSNVKIVTGDTKVVPKGACDKIYINTSGIGIYNYHKKIAPEEIKEGDVIIVNKSIAEHGIAVLLAREEFDIETDIKSDSQPLNLEIEKLKENLKNIKCMRDATRGGIGTILLELATQSNKNFEIYETEIPVNDNVRGVCEILGFDPLYIANEGVFVLFVSEDEAEDALKILKNGKIIGRVIENVTGRVFLKTEAGGLRELDMPAGELIPRIC